MDGHLDIEADAEWAVHEMRMQGKLTPHPLTYIEQIAADIYEESGGTDYNLYPPHESAMWLGYAVLALAKGTKTTSKDVHDAWVAWSVDVDYRHRSNVPFDQLSPEVQAYDNLYRDAIHAVAKRIHSTN